MYLWCRNSLFTTIYNLQKVVAKNDDWRILEISNVSRGLALDRFRRSAAQVSGRAFDRRYRPVCPPAGRDRGAGPEFVAGGSERGSGPVTRGPRPNVSSGRAGSDPSTGAGFHACPLPRRRLDRRANAAAGPGEVRSIRPACPCRPPPSRRDRRRTWSDRVAATARWGYTVAPARRPRVRRRRSMR